MVTTSAKYYLMKMMNNVGKMPKFGLMHSFLLAIKQTSLNNSLNNLKHESQEKR